MTDETTTVWVMTANSVRDKAENQTPIAIFTTHEKAVEYHTASLLTERETVGRFHLGAREDSLLRWFNITPFGDWHPPESSDRYWVVNPCLFSCQLHRYDGVPISEISTQGLPVDPVIVTQVVNS